MSSSQMVHSSDVCVELAAQASCPSPSSPSFLSLLFFLLFLFVSFVFIVFLSSCSSFPFSSHLLPFPSSEPLKAQALNILCCHLWYAVLSCEDDQGPPDRTRVSIGKALSPQRAVRKNLQDSRVKCENECSGCLCFVSCFLPSKSGIAYRNQSNLQEQRELTETGAGKAWLSGTQTAASEAKETLLSTPDLSTNSRSAWLAAVPRSWEVS